ncbi:MAG: hypothetical protein ACE5HS_19615 [bacterium]
MDLKEDFSNYKDIQKALIRLHLRRCCRRRQAQNAPFLFNNSSANGGLSTAKVW